MPQLNERGEIRAAGGVILSGDHHPVQVLMVYRSAFRDWSIPKGKVKYGETDQDAALREVREETGLNCELGRELGAMHYLDRKGRSKVARYWAMLQVNGQLDANAEVSDFEWVALDEAARRATRSGDREFLEKLAINFQNMHNPSCDGSVYFNLIEVYEDGQHPHEEV